MCSISPTARAARLSELRVQRRQPLRLQHRASSVPPARVAAIVRTGAALFIDSGRAGRDLGGATSASASASPGSIPPAWSSPLPHRRHSAVPHPSEPATFIRHFQDYPPEEFVSLALDDEVPTFATQFEHLTTLDPRVRRRLDALPLARLATVVAADDQATTCSFSGMTDGDR